uniref:Gfo/Idh/MocA-like oxidoreductase N-terminal domain-containing protein n=1 Tax=Proboscia inermis TaxID=420281 RepID=A0A7S0C0P5_9STRA|eukprot:CAMPEP_0171324148 /NCGR_PEP_ID=MMETSP0816-20121228/116004_1 /TAXON_ID=420281 /ORGANISM="Proboscia inermis, Strain CCAP1064/1" /LENGTH=401 /DNA_ID=CAMNT_0011823007 /DNA_START=802 /DNA_END=2007 /DNA_ORIENTATION=+
MTFAALVTHARGFTRSSTFLSNGVRSMSSTSGGAFRSTLQMKAESGQVEVVMVGCGAPNRGMGWYHAVQMIDKKCPTASLDFVIEPWFLGKGKTTPGGPEFAEWAAENPDIQFTTSLTDLPPPIQPRLALISGRTADNPHLLTESIKNGCKVIYLEKPGAPTVTELESMKAEAAAADVKVLMGYNKNVCKYVKKARDFAAGLPGSSVTFVSNNAYENTAASLGECFERNAEGMLKNMAIHELALLVSFYDVSVDNIESVTADKEFSSLQTLTGPSGTEWTDFDKIKFSITTKTGTTVSVQADRCGGTDSFAFVLDDIGAEVFRYYMPDEEDKAHVAELEAKYPTAMPYFFTQDPDYITVKERVAKTCLDGSEAEGVATIDIAVETLKVAEYLTPILQEQLK